MPSQPSEQACRKTIAVAVKVLIEGDAVIRIAKEVGQRVLTILKPRPTEVLAV